VSVVEKSNRDSAKRRKTRPVPVPPVMSMSELARLGGGKVAYIKVMTHDEAKELFPAVEGLPNGIDLYALHAADGTPLVLTDSHQAAVGHAMGDELEIASVH
jgi:hypothetical protein